MGSQQPEIRHHTVLEVLNLMREGMALAGVEARREPGFKQRRGKWLARVTSFRDEEPALSQRWLSEIFALFERLDDADEGHPEAAAGVLGEIVDWFPNVLKFHVCTRKMGPPPGLERFMSAAIAARNDENASVDIPLVCRHARLPEEDGWSALAYMIQEDLTDVMKRGFLRPRTNLVEHRLTELRSPPAGGGDTHHHYHGTNVAAMGPQATADRTTFQITSGGGAVVQVGGDQQVGPELVQLLGSLMGKGEAYAAAAEAVGAHAQGDKKGLLAALKRIPEKVLDAAVYPALAAYVKYELKKHGIEG
jgi:hypothetical protein